MEVTMKQNKKNKSSLYKSINNNYEVLYLINNHR